eukprot:scaffold8809_cov105-Phaeocystis_antarctica.AAC.1
MLLYFCDLAGYHPLSSKSRARSCLSRLAHVRGPRCARRRTRRTHARHEIEAYTFRHHVGCSCSSVRLHRGDP